MLGKFMSARILLALFVLLGSSFITKGQNNELPASRDVATVEYCDLIRNRDLYDGKLVHVRAIFTNDIDKRILSSPLCRSAISTWLDFRQGGYFHCPSRKVARRMSKVKSGLSADVVVWGRFEARRQQESDLGPGFGSKGMYSNRLIMNCVMAVGPSAKFKPLPDIR